jgi:CHAT domain-containing protein/Tfp pilus assembly protein PilF
MLIKISYIADEFLFNPPSQIRHRNFIRLSAMIYVATLFCISCSSPVDALDPGRTHITTLMEEANVFLISKDTDAAIESLKKAYALSQSKADYLASAAIHNQIGEIYEKIGRYQEALMQYEQGMEVIATRSAGAARVVEQALETLRASEKSYTSANGVPIGTDLYRGKIDDLLEVLIRSSKSLESELAVSLTMNAGNMYLMQNQYPQADALYKNALEMARKSALRLKIRQIYANMAWGAIKAHQYEEAEALLASAMSDIDGESQPMELRRAFLAVGVHFREKGQYQKAIEELKKAILLYERSEDQAGQCRAMTHLATAYFQKGELQKAKSHYLTALELNQQINDNTVAWHANGGLAKTFYRLGNLKASIEYYEEYMKYVDRYSSSYFTDQGRVAILEHHAAITDEYVRVAIDLAEKTGDFEPVRRAVERGRARALKSLMVAKQTRGRRKPGSLSAGPVLYGDQWSYFKLEYAAYIAGENARGVLSSPQAQMAPGVDGSVFSSLPDEESSGPRAWPQTTPPAVTFLQIYILPDRTVILIIRSEGVVGGAVVHFTAESLTELIMRYRHALDVDQPRGVTIAATSVALFPVGNNPLYDEANISKQLYRLLLKPIKDLLPSDPQKNVVIVPHQILWLLPFAALQDENGELFGDQHLLTYAASESTWRLIARRRRTVDHRNAKAWVVGNPAMPLTASRCNVSFTIDRLPGAEQEAREIAKLFPSHQAELFIDIQADRLRLDAWHPNFSVFHLATHGFACHDDPLSSYIILKPLSVNEFVLDSELETVTLHADSRYPVTLSGAKKFLKDPNMPPVQDIFYPGMLDARTIISEFDLDADLVTLSACQTGLGQLTGEGMIGFTRAFLTSGARSLLVSLWRVDDRSTKELMVSFYRQYLEHGNKGLALKRAMAETRKRYPEPKYWAGFTLLGMAE